MAKKEKKPQSKAAKIVNIIIMTIEIIIIIAGIVLSATVIFGSKTKADELGEGYNITTVLSDSMDGSLVDEYDIPSFRAKADLLIIKNLSDEEKQDLKVGDVITYTGMVSGDVQLISHRIIKIEEQGVGSEKVVVYYTLGDKVRTGNEEIDLARSAKIYTGNIQGKVTKVISNLGNIVYWFQDATHFLWSVVIPLAVLLAYNIYVLVKLIVDYRIKRAKEEGVMAVEAIKAQNTLDEEAIKRKAIEEYLAAQQASNVASDKIEDEKPQEEVKDNSLEDK